MLVDGDSGVAKTHVLAPVIAKVIGAMKIISLDDHFLKVGGVRMTGSKLLYWEDLNYSDLAAEISACSGKVVIEGLCMLKVMEKLHLPHDYHIFVRLKQSAIHWIPGTWEISPRAKEPVDSNWKSLFRYYRERKPYTVCSRRLEFDQDRFLRLQQEEGGSLL